MAAPAAWRPRQGAASGEGRGQEARGDPSTGQVCEGGRGREAGQTAIRGLVRWGIHMPPSPEASGLRSPRPSPQLWLLPAEWPCETQGPSKLSSCCDRIPVSTWDSTCVNVTHVCKSCYMVNGKTSLSLPPASWQRGRGCRGPGGPRRSPGSPTPRQCRQ